MQLDRHIAISAGGVAMMAAPDYLHLSQDWGAACFWGGVGVFVLTIMVVVTLSLHETERQRSIVGPIITMAVGAAIFMSGAAWYFLPMSSLVAPDSINPAQPQQGSSQVANQTPPSLSAAEAASLAGLADWLCRKDESSLRAEFDLIGVLEHNIDLMTKNRGPLTEKQDRLANIFGDWKVNQGEIGVLVLTERYTAASSQLDSIVKSVFLPQDVKRNLSSLQETIRQNMVLAIDELNDAYKTDPKWIFAAGKTGTIYFAAVRDRYAGKLIPLRPQVDMVCGLISSRLRTGTP